MPDLPAPGTSVGQCFIWISRGPTLICAFRECLTQRLDAIAAQLAFPHRQSVAVVGDGGFSQLMAELATAVKYELPVKIIVLKNNRLAEVLFEQAELGNPPFGCDLSPIDFAGFAKNCGADGFRCSTPGDVRAAIRQTLQSPRAAVLEAVVDANEKPALPDELRV